MEVAPALMIMDLDAEAARIWDQPFHGVCHGECYIGSRRFLDRFVRRRLYMGSSLNWGPFSQGALRMTGRLFGGLKRAPRQRVHVPK